MPSLVAFLREGVPGTAVGMPRTPPISVGGGPSGYNCEQIIVLKAGNAS